MASTSKSTRVFSLEGKGLKLDTREQTEAHIKALRDMDDVEEIRLQGNTLGIEACKVLGAVLETKKTLRVRRFATLVVLMDMPSIHPLTDSSSPISQIYSQDDYSARSRQLFPHSSLP